jgi:hypothetical protein
MTALGFSGARPSSRPSRFPKTLASLLFLAIAPLCASAGPSNRTIDDETGDAVTGAMPVYQPADQWNYGPDCSTCHVQPEPSRVHGNSWHDTTVHVGEIRNITLTFTGA